MSRGTASEIRMLPLNKIKLGRNSRLNVTKEELDGLMQSIKEVGLLQAIGVVPGANGGYEIAYGNRRFMAASKLGLSHIPAMIHEDAGKSQVELKNLTENIQRRNISLHEAGRYMSLLQEQGLTTAEIAVRIGITRTYVDTCLKAYGEVPKEYQKDLEVRTTNAKPTPGKISIAAARAIINAQKTHRLTVEKVKPLWEAARKGEAVEANASAMAQAIKQNKPLTKAKKFRFVTLNLKLTQAEFERLERKYITNGQFTFMGQVLTAILKGEVKEHIRV